MSSGSFWSSDSPLCWGQGLSSNTPTLRVWDRSWHLSWRGWRDCWQCSSVRRNVQWITWTLWDLPRSVSFCLYWLSVCSSLHNLIKGDWSYGVKTKLDLHSPTSDTTTEDTDLEQPREPPASSASWTSSLLWQSNGTVLSLSPIQSVVNVF